MNRHSLYLMLAPGMLTAGLIGCVTPLRAQTFRHVGAHFGCNLSNFADDPIDLARVGAQGVLSVAGPLSFYPAASVHLDRAQWQVSGLARVDLTPSSARVPFYFGGGVSYLNWDGPEARFYDVLFWGLKAGLGRYQPFVEMWFMDGIARLTTTGGDFAVQAYVGVNLALR